MNLIEALLWRVDAGLKQPSMRSFETYVAPSWSWLFINASIRWVEWGRCGLPTSLIVASEVVLAKPDDAYGSLTDARLHIRGWVSTVHMNASMKRKSFAGAWCICRKVNYKGVKYYAELTFQ
jgi:hypothetical protein